MLRILGVGVQRRPISGDDEEGVVDTERQREHHREVQRPDRQVGDLGDAVQHAHRGEQAGSGEHERKARSSQRAEGDHEDHRGHRPGEQFGLEHAFAIEFVEVVPEGGRARQCDEDLVARDLSGQVADVIAQTLCGADCLGRIDVGTGLDHHGLAVHARLWRRGLAEPFLRGDQGVDLGHDLLERRIVDGGRPALHHDDR